MWEHYSTPVYGHSRMKTVPAWTEVAANIVTRLTAQDVGKEAIAALEADTNVGRHMGQPAGNADGVDKVTVHGCLSGLVSALFARQGKAACDVRVFDTLYHEFRLFFDSDTIVYRYVAPVSGIKVAADRLQIGDYRHVARATTADRARMIGPAHYVQPYAPAFVCDATIECEIVTEKIVGDVPAGDKGKWLQHAESKLEQMCTAIRLVVDARIHFDEIHIWPKHWNPVATDLMLTLSLGPRRSDYQEFSVAHANEVSELLKRLEALAGDGSLEQALRRFNFGYNRASNEDRIVDHLIAFESLLLEKNDMNELSYRLAHRGAALIGDDAQRRREVFHLLREAYTQRSRIVHGQKPRALVRVEGVSFTFDQLVGASEDMLRESICRAVTTLSNDPEVKLVELLEARIFG